MVSMFEAGWKVRCDVGLDVGREICRGAFGAFMACLLTTTLPLTGLTGL